MAKPASRIRGRERFLGNNFQSRSPEFKVGQSVLRAGDRQRGKVGPSWLQSRSAAFCGEDAFGTAGTISTRRVDSFRAKLPPCFLTRTILTRAVRDPPRVWASTTDFFEEKGSGVLNPTPKYRSRPLPLRLKTILAQESTETCGQRRPKNQALRGPLLRRTQRPVWSCHT